LTCSRCIPLRGATRDLRLGSGLTANRKNLPYASELYPAFNISSRSPRPALCIRPLLALLPNLAIRKVTSLELPSDLISQPNSPPACTALSFAIRIAGCCPFGSAPPSFESNASLASRWIIDRPVQPDDLGSVSPPVPHLPLAPTLHLRVTPRVLRLALRATAFRVVSCETAFDACPSAVPWDGYSSCLESRIPWTALWVEGSSCLESLSLGVAVWASSGCPESCFDGWVDDGSPSVLELCIPGLRRG